MTYIYDGTLASVPNITNAAVTTVIPGQFSSGSAIGATFRAGGWQGTASPGTIQASAGNATGALTFQFDSDTSVTAAGWSATIVELATAACAITPAANQTISTGTLNCTATATTALPTFTPGGCAAAFTLQYRVNGGAATVIPAPFPASITIPNLPKATNTIQWQLVDACFGAVAASANQTITVLDLTPPALVCPPSVTLNLPPGECSTFFSYNVSASDNCPGITQSFHQNLSWPQVVDIALVCSNAAADAITYYRVFPMTAATTVQSIDLGVWQATPGFPFTVRLYNLTGALNFANLAAPGALLSTTVYNPAALANATTINIPLTPTPVQPGQQLVVAIEATGTAVGAGSSVGFDLAGEVAPTFVSGCNVTLPGFFPDITNMDNLGFPRGLILQVNLQSPAFTLAQTAGLASGSEFPIGTTTNCFLATDAANNTSTCCFNVTVLEYPNPIQSLVCNDLVQVSLDQNCTAVVGADQVLEGGPYGCYDDYIVELDKTAPFGNGPWLPAVLGPGDVGKTYQVRVTDPDTGNKCWGNLKVEDKLPPVLDCPAVDVPCNAAGLPGEIAALVNVDASFPSFASTDGVNVTATTNVALPAGVPVTGLTVHFQSSHTWVGDIDCKLTAPNGTTILLFDRPGVPASAFGCANAGIDVVFDDGAAQTAAQFENTCNAANPTISGDFQAIGSIASLLAGNPNGTWTIGVQDYVGGDGGQINATLQFSTLQAVPFPNGLVQNVNVFANGGGCYTVTAGAGTPVLEPCSDASLCYLDTEVSQNCASGLTKIINRKWTARDASGNTATCIQQIRFQRASLNDVTLPPSYDDINAPALECNSAYPTPDFLEGSGLQGYPYVFGSPDGCSVGWTYEDAVIDVCDGTYKIRRKWTLIDWCTGNDAEHNQIIKVLDDAGPAIACPANLTVGTDPFTCCASANLPDVIVEDNCSRIAKVSAMVTTFDPQTNAQTGMYQFNGTLTSFPGNNLWDLDTLANFGNTPCLPLGTHTVVYTAEDDCGNTSTCSFRLTVRDYTPPVAACDEFTVVGIGVDDPFDCYLPSDACNFAGVTWVKATTFDDGSYDNCGPVKLTVRRMLPYSDCISGLNAINGHPECDPTIDPFPDFPSEFERAISEYDSIKFYCCEVGTTQTVILRVYQLDVNGNITVGPDGTPVFNECMIQVEVQDKIKPVCQSPANVTVSCENFDPSLWVYGKASVYDNCCLDTAQVYQGQCGLSHTASYTLFDTVCNKGTITRTFRAFDCHGFSSQCTQRIFVNYEQDYFVKFPNDVIVTVCDGTGNYGEPTFFGEDCELLGVSHVDELFTVVPDACYKIERTWTIINWCTYNPNLGCINVPNPNPNATVNHPSNLPGPTVSPAGTPAPWNPTVVKINSTDPLTTNYSVFYDANANCYKYKQIIKVIDTQDPIVTCPASPVEVCDLTPNDPYLWNEMYWYDATINSHDLCEGPTDLSITATDLCSGANINIRYLLFLDLDGDGSMETVISSTNLPGYNNVQFGNANNPNFSGGTSRQFDGRPVLPNQKYGFALQTTTSGTNKTGSVRWNTQQSQNTYVIPELPYGTHKIKWIIEDGCSNETVCEYTFVVKDCKKPTVVCINGLSVNIMPTKMIQLWDTDFLKYTEDNCTPSNQLVTAIRRSGTGTGFPLNPDGTPQKNVVFTCDDLGTQLVELWSIDKAGNADYCETYVIIQDNMGACSNTVGTVAGALKTEMNKGLEDANVDLNGTHPALPPVNMFTTTDVDGNYDLAGIPFLGNYTVTPNKDNDPLNGVSTFDLVLINKHILGLEPLNTPYKMIGADANNSRSITTFDIVELRKLILGIYTELPNNTSWRFVDKSYTFPNAANPFQAIFPETKQIADMQVSQMDEHFVSVKVGDVNGNAVTSSLMSTDDRTAGTLLFDVEDRAVKAGETFTVTFKASEKVQGYQFTLNHAGLELVDVKPGANMSMANFGVFASEQALTTSWDGDVQAEFALTFRATASGELSRMLGVSGRITKAEAYNAGAERLQVGFRFNGANGQTITGLGFELYQNTPNPFVNKTQIGFHLPEATTATLTIFDETGRMLFTQKGDFAKGYNAVTVDRSVLNATGVLYYTLETAKESATRKMIQTK